RRKARDAGRPASGHQASQIMTRPSDTPDETRLLAEAVAWRVSFSDSGAESSAAFEAWLASSQGHADAWRRIQGSWDGFAERATSPEFIAARRDALNRARRVGRRR